MKDNLVLVCIVSLIVVACQWTHEYYDSVNEANGYKPQAYEVIT